MTTFRISILKRADGSADAWVVDLPGCRATGRDFEDAMQLLPVVVGEHLAWLQGHGESVSAFEPVDFTVVEELETRGEFVFASDQEPLGREELEVALHHAGYAHADFMALQQGLPASVLDWKPPASAVKIDRIYPDVRSIREMVEHCARTEAFLYLGVLSPDRARRQDTPDLARLHEQTLAAMRALPEEALGRLYTRPAPSGEAYWTVRKLARRIVAHKRFHTREIEQRLCWLTLGVPEVLPESRE